MNRLLDGGSQTIANGSSGKNPRQKAACVKCRIGGRFFFSSIFGGRLGVWGDDSLLFREKLFPDKR